MAAKRKTKKKTKKVSVVDEVKGTIEYAVDLGRFIDHYDEYAYIEELEDAREYVRGLATDKRYCQAAIELYEYFIACCYEKIEEVNTETDFHYFVETLFVDWINARQAADCDAEETLRLLLKWDENDDYCLCISAGDAAKAMDRHGRKIYKQRLLQQFEKAYAKETKDGSNEFNKLSWSTRKPATDLKEVYCVTKDANSYVRLCQTLEPSPCDCENIATIFKDKRKYDIALEWTEKGIKLEKVRDWHNERSHGLAGLKRELLAKVGRKEEALEAAWVKFQDYPSDMGYEELMKYVPRNQRAKWRKKVVETACSAKLDSNIVRLLFELKERGKLSDLIMKSNEKTLEGIFYYDAAKIAEKLERSYKPAAARLYLALTMDIVKAGRSKAYHYAIEYCDKLKTLYEKTGQNKKWIKLIDYFRQNHNRKRSLMNSFEAIIDGDKRKDENTLRQPANKRLKKIR